MMAKWMGAVVVLFFTILTASCSEPERSVRPNERYLVDSIYTLKIDSVRLEIEAICSTYQNRYYETAVDSIIEQRVMEIQNLRR